MLKEGRRGITSRLERMYVKQRQFVVLTPFVRFVLDSELPVCARRLEFPRVITATLSANVYRLNPSGYYR
jgi:hypothetical protein